MSLPSSNVSHFSHAASLISDPLKCNFARLEISGKEADFADLVDIPRMLRFRNEISQNHYFMDFDNSDIVIAIFHEFVRKTSNISKRSWSIFPAPGCL